MSLIQTVGSGAVPKRSKRESETSSILFMDLPAESYWRIDSSLSTSLLRSQNQNNILNCFFHLSRSKALESMLCNAGVLALPQGYINHSFRFADLSSRRLRLALISVWYVSADRPRVDLIGSKTNFSLNKKKGKLDAGCVL
jgi:hypothetical protein